MPANTPLWKAHDISERLQDKIEVLPNVDRAFVHVDHETTHMPVRLTLGSQNTDRLTSLFFSRNTGSNDTCKIVSLIFFR